MSDSFSNNNRIVLDLYDQKISKLPIEDPYELENVLIHAAQKLTDNNDAVILEALLNTLVDYYVFDLEPGDDIEDVGFLVSDIEDRVCNAIAFRRHLASIEKDDDQDIEVCPLTVDDVRQINDLFGTSVPEDYEDDDEEEEEDTCEEEQEQEQEEGCREDIGCSRAGDDKAIDCPEPIPVIQRPCKNSNTISPRDSDDISDKDIPGMMKRFESDGFEVTVTLIPKREFDAD